jgi:fused signal recognition particle receptor
MPFDPSEDPLVSKPRRVSPGVMLAGVTSACLLGAGLGLWARPSNDAAGPARPHATAPSLATGPRQIEIRVDDPPASAAAQVARRAPEAVAPPGEPPAEGTEPVAPQRAPEGLVKVHAVAPPRLVDTDDAALRRVREAAERRAEADAAAERKAQAARAEREAEKREVRAEAKAAALRKARKEEARIAEAEARAEAQAKAKAEHRLAERQAAEQITAKKADAERRQAKLLAQKRANEKLATQARKPTPKAVAVATVTKAKLAKAPARCVSEDPGAALTCSDPTLSAADRQLARAYRQAEAAGVPTERLERQQRRWLAARANAARQAPWAVHDIYLARIAELQDQTLQASRRD